MTHSQPIIELAEALPEHQTSRGAEFRTTDVEDRLPLARILFIARHQAQNSSETHGQLNNYTIHMVHSRSTFFHEAGRLDIDRQEAEAIWWSVVYDNPSPNERSCLV